MPDVKHGYRISLDAEKYSIDMRPVSIEQLPNLEWKHIIFWRNSATVRETIERCYRLS